MLIGCKNLSNHSIVVSALHSRGVLPATPIFGTDNTSPVCCPNGVLAAQAACAPQVANVKLCVSNDEWEVWQCGRPVSNTRHSKFGTNSVSLRCQQNVLHFRSKCAKRHAIQVSSQGLRRTSPHPAQQRENMHMERQRPTAPQYRDPWARSVGWQHEPAKTRTRTHRSGSPRGNYGVQTTPLATLTHRTRQTLTTTSTPPRPAGVLATPPLLRKPPLHIPTPDAASQHHSPILPRRRRRRCRVPFRVSWRRRHPSHLAGYSAFAVEPRGVRTHLSQCHSHSRALGLLGRYSPSPLQPDAATCRDPFAPVATPHWGTPSRPSSNNSSQQLARARICRAWMGGFSNRQHTKPTPAFPRRPNPPSRMATRGSPRIPYQLWSKPPTPPRPSEPSLACPPTGILRNRSTPLERAAARMCREAGARVTTNTWLTDLNLDHIHRQDDRRIEVIANGLPIWGGAQLAVDTTIVSPLTRDGQPRRRAGQYAGTALTEARRRKERTYPELMRSQRCRLVVLGIETGGRWRKAASFVRLLAHAKARQAPRLLQHSVAAALINRWTAQLTHAALQAFAASLLDQDCTHLTNVEGNDPLWSQLLAEAPDPPPEPSRLPAPP